MTETLDFIERDRMNAINWAKAIMANPSEYVVLDTETTGLKNAQAIELAVTDLKGNAILNCRCKPTIPIEPGATNVHGITDDDVSALPGFEAYWQPLDLICKDKTILIYNSAYDMRIIHNSCLAVGFDLGPAGWDVRNECVMQNYAEYYGDWNPFRKSYKWQKLKGGDHSALGDCRATIQRIEEMAHAQ